MTFYDSEKDKHFEFITNDLKMSALTIAMIYKQRWQIELLFKRLKQSFPLKYFLGDNENAIKIQVWCVLIADLLISYIKRTISNKHRWSYANLASMI
ncbi:MAG: transposase [Saprospiraceae bacterium]